MLLRLKAVNHSFGRQYIVGLVLDDDEEGLEDEEDEDDDEDLDDEDVGLDAVYKEHLEVLTIILNIEEPLVRIFITLCM
jgi:hypothetical protein